MRALLLDTGLLVGVVASLAVAGARMAGDAWRASPAAVPLPGRTLAVDVKRDTAESLEELLDRISESNPFRLDRGADGDELPEQRVPAVATPGVVRLARPALTVSAILGGPPWQAVLGGLPGQTGEVVVRPGMHIGPYVVLDITRDTVIVNAVDTTLRLTLRREVP